LFIARTLLGLLLAAVIVLAALGAQGWSGVTNEVFEPDELWSFGGVVFIVLSAIAMVVVMMFAVTTVSPAIAEEREKGTLALLLLTRLSRLEIVLTKLVARSAPSFSLALVVWPLAAGCAWCAGLPVVVLVEAMMMVVAASVVVGGMATLASARRDRVATARAQAMSWSFIWLVIIPVVSIAPFRAGTLWGDLAVELRRACRWIAPSSPLSLATRSAWFSSRGPGALTEQVVIMLALQGAMVALAVLGAAASLRIREPRPNWWDPHQGFRPPVGDDPVFWREYDLPLRGSRRPVLFVQLRQAFVFLRLLLIMVLQLVVLTIALAVPIGLAIGTARFGYFAFRELTIQGYSTASPTPARSEFNLFIRAVTAFLAILPLLSVSAITTGRITIERDRKTWEALLTTPLTGAEILSAKMRATARRFWTSCRWLIPIWALGVISGSVHPMSALCAAALVPLAVWAALVLGAWLGVRPASTLTSTANSHAALASLGLTALAGPTLLALLCSPRELVVFGTWDIGLRALVFAALATCPIILGASAWTLERRMFHRFDEWVGRPHQEARSRLRLIQPI
jgi:ABC-type Na+ efflux pump permease subunit